MGVMADLREELKLPDMSMQYQDGGRVESYSFNGKQVQLTAPVSVDQVREAIKAVLAE